jgi:hypothetical protein
MSKLKGIVNLKLLVFIPKNKNKSLLTNPVPKIPL